MRSPHRDRTHLCAVIAGAILLSGCADRSAAEPQGRVMAVDQVAGVWAMSGPDGARCTVSLANLVIDGVRPVLAETCGIAAAMQAKSWRATAQGCEMLDADGAVLMHFRRTGEDSFQAVSGGYRLSRVPLS